MTERGKVSIHPPQSLTGLARRYSHHAPGLPGFLVEPDGPRGAHAKRLGDRVIQS